MNAPQPSIVFVDNSVHLLFKTIETLKAPYPNIQVFKSDTDLFEYLQNETPHVIFLNLDLTPNDAVLITREIRIRHPKSPPYIVIYSNKQDDFVQEMAFNSGADSFMNFQHKATLVKLFIDNLLRRQLREERTPSRKVHLDGDRYLIFKQGEAFQLPRKEFKLFELLYTNSDRFFSKPEIADLIWSDSTVAKKRTIDVHIYNIRQLFGKRIIQSQKGKGYRINKKAID